MTSTLLKPRRKLLLIAIAWALVCVSSSAVYACIDSLGLIGGRQVFVSCGSSAGNYTVSCAEGGGDCVIDTGPEFQALADAWCGSPWSCNAQ